MRSPSTALSPPSKRRCGLTCLVFNILPTGISTEGLKNNNNNNINVSGCPVLTIPVALPCKSWETLTVGDMAVLAAAAGIRNSLLGDVVSVEWPSVFSIHRRANKLYLLRYTHARKNYKQVVQRHAVVNDVGMINEVNRRRAWLIREWVTVFRRVNRLYKKSAN